MQDMSTSELDECEPVLGFLAPACANAAPFDQPTEGSFDGLASQVPVGIEEGLKNDGSIHCDELISLLKSALTYYVGTLSPSKMEALDQALRVALDLPN